MVLFFKIYKDAACDGWTSQCFICLYKLGKQCRQCSKDQVQNQFQRVCAPPQLPCLYKNCLNCQVPGPTGNMYLINSACECITVNQNPLIPSCTNIQTIPSKMSNSYQYGAELSISGQTAYQVFQKWSWPQGTNIVGNNPQNITIQSNQQSLIAKIDTAGLLLINLYKATVITIPSTNTSNNYSVASASPTKTSNSSIPFPINSSASTSTTNNSGSSNSSIKISDSSTLTTNPSSKPSLINNSVSNFTSKSLSSSNSSIIISNSSNLPINTSKPSLTSTISSNASNLTTNNSSKPSTIISNTSTLTTNNSVYSNSSINTNNSSTITSSSINNSDSSILLSLGSDSMILNSTDAYPSTYSINISSESQLISGTSTPHKDSSFTSTPSQMSIITSIYTQNTIETSLLPNNTQSNLTLSPDKNSNAYLLHNSPIAVADSTNRASNYTADDRHYSLIASIPKSSSILSSKELRLTKIYAQIQEKESVQVSLSTIKYLGLSSFFLNTPQALTQLLILKNVKAPQLFSLYLIVSLLNLPHSIVPEQYNGINYNETKYTFLALLEYGDMLKDLQWDRYYQYLGFTPYFHMNCLGYLFLITLFGLGWIVLTVLNKLLKVSVDDYIQLLQLFVLNMLKGGMVVLFTSVFVTMKVLHTVKDEGQIDLKILGFQNVISLSLLLGFSLIFLSMISYTSYKIFTYNLRIPASVEWVRKSYFTKHLRPKGFLQLFSRVFNILKKMLCSFLLIIYYDEPEIIILLMIISQMFYAAYLLSVKPDTRQIHSLFSLVLQIVFLVLMVATLNDVQNLNFTLAVDEEDQEQSLEDFVKQGYTTYILALVLLSIDFARLILPMIISRLAKVLKDMKPLLPNELHDRQFDEQLYIYDVSQPSVTNVNTPQSSNEHNLKLRAYQLEYLDFVERNKDFIAQMQRI